MNNNPLTPLSQTGSKRYCCCRRRQYRLGRIGIVALLLICLSADCLRAAPLPSETTLAPAVRLNLLPPQLWSASGTHKQPLAALLRHSRWIRLEPLGAGINAARIQHRFQEFSRQQIDIAWLPVTRTPAGVWSVYDLPLTDTLTAAKNNNCNVCLRLDHAPDEALLNILVNSNMAAHTMLCLSGTNAWADFIAATALKRRQPDITLAIDSAAIPAPTLARRLLTPGTAAAIDALILPARPERSHQQSLIARAARAQGKQVWLDARDAPDRTIIAGITGILAIEPSAIPVPNAPPHTPFLLPAGLKRAATISITLLTLTLAAVITAISVIAVYPAALHVLYQFIVLFYPLMDAYLSLFAGWPAWLQAMGIGFANSFLVALINNLLAIRSRRSEHLTLAALNRHIGRALLRSLAWGTIIGAGVLGAGLFGFFLVLEYGIPGTTGWDIAAKTTVQAVAFAGFCYGAIFLYITCSLTLPSSWLRTRAFWRAWTTLLKHRFFPAWRVDVAWWYTLFTPMAFLYIPPIERIFSGGVWAWFFEPIRYWLVHQQRRQGYDDIAHANARAQQRLQSLWWILPLLQDHRLWLAAKALHATLHDKPRVPLAALIAPALDQLFINIYQALPSIYRKQLSSLSPTAVRHPADERHRAVLARRQLRQLHAVLSLYPETRARIKAEIKKFLWGALLAADTAANHAASLLDVALPLNDMPQQTTPERLTVKLLRQTVDGSGELLFTRTRKSIPHDVSGQAAPYKEQLQAANNTITDITAWMDKALRRVTMPAQRDHINLILRQRSNGECADFSRVGFVLDIANTWRAEGIEPLMRHAIQTRAQALSQQYRLDVQVQWRNTDDIIAARAAVQNDELADYQPRPAPAKKSRPEVLPRDIAGLTHIVLDVDDTLIHHEQEISNTILFSLLFIYATTRLTRKNQPPQPDEWYRFIAGLKTRVDEQPALLTETIMPTATALLGEGARLWFDYIHQGHTPGAATGWAHRRAQDFVLFSDMLNGVLINTGATSIPDEDYLRLFNQLHDRFFSSTENVFFPPVHYKPSPRLRELLRAARQTGLRLGIITNGTRQHVDKHLLEQTLENEFPPNAFAAIVTVDSHPDLAYLEKPEQTIYRYFMEKSGAAIDANILMLGDSLLNDVEGPPDAWATMQTRDPTETIRILEYIIAVRKHWQAIPPSSPPYPIAPLPIAHAL